MEQSSSAQRAMNPSCDSSLLLTPKQQYRQLKRRFKFLVYENECYQEELRNLQRKLLKLSRDKNFLLDRLIPFEKLSDSSDESDANSIKTEEKKPKRKSRPSASRKKPTTTTTKQELSPPPISGQSPSTADAIPCASNSNSGTPTFAAADVVNNGGQLSSSTSKDVVGSI